MTIHLSGHSEQLILSLLQAGKFASSDDVIDEALRLVEERYYETDREPRHAKERAGCSNRHISADRTTQQLENLSKLVQKLDAMPAGAVTDGLSNRDHDWILYGK
jgi:Arc/MetJ-type ribon-helix-helix transcriptional regulator